MAKQTQYRTDIAHKTEVYFSRPAKEPEQLKVVRVSREQWGLEYHALRKAPDYRVIVYVARGAGFFVGCRGRVELSSGMIYTRAPGPPNEYGCSPDDPLEVFMVSVVGAEARKLFSRCVPTANHAFAIGNAHEVAQVFELMVEQAAGEAPFASQICDRYAAALLTLIRQGVLEMPVANSRARQTYLEARQYIRGRFLRLRTAGEVASHCGVTQAHLCRLFRRFGDDSPHAYLQRLKMNHAAHLLATTPKTVKEIADALGYPDPFSFSKSFKKWHALSPRQYRSQAM